MFFSSGLRRDFGPGSDVDVLAYFEAGQAVGFLRLPKMENALAGIPRHKGDVRTLAEDLECRKWLLEGG